MEWGIPCRGSLSDGWRRVEDGFEIQFAGFGEFEGAGEVGTAGGFENNGVRARGKFQGGGGVTVELAVDVDFGSVGLEVIVSWP